MLRNRAAILIIKIQNELFINTNGFCIYCACTQNRHQPEVRLSCKLVPFSSMRMPKIRHQYAILTPSWLVPPARFTFTVVAIEAFRKQLSNSFRNFNQFIWQVFRTINETPWKIANVLFRISLVNHRSRFIVIYIVLTQPLQLICCAGILVYIRTRYLGSLSDDQFWKTLRICVGDPAHLCRWMLHFGYFPAHVNQNLNRDLFTHRDLDLFYTLWFMHLNSHLLLYNNSWKKLHILHLLKFHI